MPSHRSLLSEEAVRELWDRVPPVECKGLCAKSCGPAPHTVAEARIIGVLLFDAEMTCSKLTGFGRCSIYEDRPLVCRLWGATPDMPCQWGCKPTMTSDEARALTREMMRRGGELIAPEVQQ